ncbi:hypothetical protein ACU686_42165 [Yinghuangia aomiensis]
MKVISRCWSTGRRGFMPRTSRRPRTPTTLDSSLGYSAICGNVGTKASTARSCCTRSSPSRATPGTTSG